MSLSLVEKGERISILKSLDENISMTETHDKKELYQDLINQNLDKVEEDIVLENATLIADGLCVAKAYGSRVINFMFTIDKDLHKELNKSLKSCNFIYEFVSPGIDDVIAAVLKKYNIGFRFIEWDPHVPEGIKYEVMHVQLCYPYAKYKGLSKEWDWESDKK